MIPLARWTVAANGGDDGTVEVYIADHADARIAELEAELAQLRITTEVASRHLIRERDDAWAERDAARADAERYQWLLENCAHSYGMSIDSPAEHHIMWSWQQAIPAERDWTLEQALDAAIDAARSKE